jgi:hypothetical protein
MKKILLGFMASAWLMLSGAANATLLVNTYLGVSGIANAETAIATKAPDLTTTTSVVNFDDGMDGSGRYANDFAFPSGGAHEFFSLNIKGFVNVVTAGTYSFRSYADDGAQMKIDGVTLFSDSSGHGPLDFSGTITLGAGLHSLDYIYFQYDFGAMVELDAGLVGPQGQVTYALLGAPNGLATTIPEPGSVALLGLGFLGFVVARRKSKNNC